MDGFQQFPIRPSCCGCSLAAASDVSRRGFLGTVAIGGLALTGLSWSALSASAAEATAADVPPARQPLVVKPILTYSVYGRQPKTSWRAWGGLQTQKDADEEVVRIKKDLEKVKAMADFPVTFLPVSAIRGGSEVANLTDAATADAVILFAGAGGKDALDAIGNLKKNTIIFIRHKSGPVYLWYEIIHPVYFRSYGDQVTVKGIDYQDVVIDSLDEVVWRLRALCGLKNALGTRIIAIGGAGYWGAGAKALEQAANQWKLDIQTVSYDDLGKLIRSAREDKATVALARERARKYLKHGLTLETQQSFVENAFLLEQVFRGLMAQAGAHAITVNSCMSTIMPMAETTACLTLSLLNDAGYMAFCESDFVVIPSGILLSSISGLPMFLNDPTYPHDGIITLAHCTAPRKLNGKSLEPARILTHFESDYGAAPKVKMHKGQPVTMIAPDFSSARWVGLGGEIADNPFMPICRSQVDVAFKVDSLLVAQKMPGFHWMMIYGDYLREAGYAAKRIPINWECLG